MCQELKRRVGMTRSLSCHSEHNCRCRRILTSLEDENDSFLVRRRCHLLLFLFASLQTRKCSVCALDNCRLTRQLTFLCPSVARFLTIIFFSLFPL